MESQSAVWAVQVIGKQAGDLFGKRCDGFCEGCCYRTGPCNALEGKQRPEADEL